MEVVKNKYWDVVEAPVETSPDMPELFWPERWSAAVEHLEPLQSDRRDVLKFKGALIGSGAPVIVYQVTPASPDDWTFWRNQVNVAKRFNGGFFAQVLNTREFEDPVRGRSILFCRLDPVDNGAGTLGDLMHSPAELTMDVKMKIIVQVLRSIETMSRAGYIHTGLSPEAVLISGDCKHPSRCHAALDIFGHVRSVKRPSSSARAHLSDFFADREYMSPEVAAGRSTGVKRDVWPAGIMFYELLHGMMPIGMYEPFDDDLHFAQYISYRFDIAKDEDFQSFADFYPSLAVILENMLRRDPKQRWSAKHSLREIKKVAKKFPEIVSWVDMV